MIFGAKKPEYESHSAQAIKEQLKYVESDKTKDYIEKRLLDQIKYYGKSSKKSKFWYQILMAASILTSASIPVCAAFVDDTSPVKIPIAILGATVTAISALLSMYNYRDLWVTHRGVRQDLEHTLYFYFNNVDEFSKKGTQEEKDARLIEICESILDEEKKKWIFSQKKSDQADNEK